MVAERSAAEVLPVTLVVPTRDREVVMRRTLPGYLRQGAAEVVVVDDGSVDGTAAYLSQMAAAHPGDLRVVRLETPAGLPAARNAGADAAVSPWVLYGEDDMIMLDGAARTALECAEATGADLVGLRVVYPRRDETFDEAFARDPGRREVLGIPAGVVDPSAGPVPAAFTQAIMLCRTELVRSLRYDQGYGGNAYREESDFQARAVSGGAALVACPDARCVHLRPFADRGGAHAMSPAVFEWWTVRNTVRFIRRNAAYLRTVDGGAGPLALTARMVAERFDRHVGARIRRRWSRV